MNCPVCKNKLEELPSNGGKFCTVCSYQDLDLPGYVPNLEPESIVLEPEYIETYLEGLSEDDLIDIIELPVKEVYVGNERIDIYQGQEQSKVVDCIAMSYEWDRFPEVPTVSAEMIEEILYG